MKFDHRFCLLAAALASTVRCASTTPAAAPEPITPSDFVASIADVAAGQNAAAAEAGLVLKRIEFRLTVGTETTAGGTLEVLLLEAEASRTSETSFLQELTLEIPADRGKRVAVAPRPLVPGVRAFIDAAMNTARDLARATAAAGLPQRVRSVELTAKIRRSKKAGGGITATIPAWVKPSVGVEGAASRDEENVVKLTFEAKGE